MTRNELARLGDQIAVTDALHDDGSLDAQYPDAERPEYRTAGVGW